MNGVELREKKGGKFWFRLHLTHEMTETSIDALDLTVRAYHSLKRAGYNTIGDVANAIAAGQELKNIRNCGTKSAREIMESLFLYQYHALKPERQEAYLDEVTILNLEKNR